MTDKKKIVSPKFKKEFQDDYIQYLLRLFENEDKRLSVIEAKISQLISQSGLIISIVAFIVPLFYDNLKDLNLCSKIFLGVVFLTTVVLIGISIFRASEVLKVYKFNYSDCSTLTLQQDFKKLKDFKTDYINDLMHSINNNRVQNNKKATILIQANKFFIYGIYGLICLTITLLVMFFTY